MRSLFGWSLPPGCSNRDIENAYGGRDPTEEEDQILDILERNNVPTDQCDAVMLLVDQIYRGFAREKEDVAPEDDIEPTGEWPEGSGGGS